ncbi:MAG: hypothetical protein HY544_01715 [Candidatus Diapherotrites archaeon]|uniref:Uncharacterized protein n=1 Tax=Candidatus Iainarchaeum sp. TaxID=3101447 RepID=A0A8T3YI42_9ARCH|nr:hypothetical protein [Candidatus Diapherotrites archaeon]
MSTYDEFKGTVRPIMNGGKRVQIARSHSAGELDNAIPDLKIGDIVVCNSFTTLKKI